MDGDLSIKTKLYSNKNRCKYEFVSLNCDIKIIANVVSLPIAANSLLSCLVVTIKLVLLFGDP